MPVVNLEELRKSMASSPATTKSVSIPQEAFDPTVGKTSATAPRQSTNASPVPQNRMRTDESASLITEELVKVVTNNTTDIKAEQRSLEDRLRYHENMITAAQYMAMGGQGQAASVLLTSSSDQIGKIQYLLGQMKSNPELYKQGRKLSIIAELGQSLQGIGSIIGAKYYPEQFATQKYVAELQARAASAAGYGSYDNSSSIDQMIEVMKMMASFGKGKDKELLMEWTKSLLASIAGRMQ